MSASLSARDPVVYRLLAFLANDFTGLADAQVAGNRIRYAEVARQANANSQALARACVPR